MKFLLIGLLCSSSAFAQHGHLNVGAAGKNQGDKLIWANGDIFAADSGFVRTMIYTNGGRFANTYNQNISLTALAATEANGGPIPNAPALGSFIITEVVSVEGPEGGAFSFWETNSGNAPAWSAPVGMPAASAVNYAFDLSDPLVGAGKSPTSDPYGHIHGRRFSLNKPGLYTVGFRARDISTHGQDSGPIHMPSDTILINFSTVLTFGKVTNSGDNLLIQFKANSEYHYDIEYTEDLPAAPASWKPAGVELDHRDEYVTLDLPRTGPRRYYRIKSTHDPHP